MKNWIPLILMLLVSSCLAGCGSRAPRQDTVVVGMPWEPRTFNPYRGLDSASFFAHTLVHGSLVQYDANFRLRPSLAESYEISGDGKTYKFNLRKNLKFSDGTPITAKDVVDSINVARAPGSPFRGNYDVLTGCEATSPLQVVVHLSSKNLPLMSRFADLRIVPAGSFAKGIVNAEKLARAPIGCGPFRLQRWDPGFELVFEANPYYYGEKAKSKYLIWRVIPDGNLLSAALRRGDVDVARVDGRTDIDMLSKTTDVKVKEFRSARTVYLAFNTRKAPYSNDKFRQAISMFIDKGAIVGGLYRGYAVLPSNDFPRSSPVWCKHARVWPYHPNLARKYLTSCGFEERSDGWYKTADHAASGKDAQRLSFKIVTIRDFVDVAQVVAADLQNAKIGVRVELIEYSTMKDKYLSTGDFDCVLFSRTQGPDPDCRLTWAKNGPSNYAQYKNDELDKLINDAYFSGDENERKVLYERVQLLLSDRLPWVFLVQPDLTIAYKSYIDGVGEGLSQESGLPWDNPLYNAQQWSVRTNSLISDRGL